MELLRKFFVVAGFAVLWPTTIVAGCLVRLGEVIGGDCGPSQRVEMLHRLAVRFLLWLSPSEVMITGQERLPPGQALVFVPNHESTLDIVAILAMLDTPLRFVSKRILFFAFPTMFASGHILVRRDRSGRDMSRVMAEGRELLARSISVVFFAEGSRTRDGSLQKFRLGAFELASANGGTIVPVAIRGTGRLMGPSNWLPSAGTATIDLLEPIYVQQGTDPASLAAETRRRIADHLARSAAPAPSGPTSPEILDVTLMDQMRLRRSDVERMRTWLPHSSALVMDMDKCLVRSYVGVDVWTRLAFQHPGLWPRLLSWAVAAVRLRLGRTHLAALMPAACFTSAEAFQTATLALEGGVTREVLEAAVERMRKEVRDRIRPDLAALCAEARVLGVHVVIATANSEIFARAVAEEVGADAAIASRYDRASGCCSTLAVGAAKVDLVRKHLIARGLDPDNLMAVADVCWSGNDLPLLRSARRAVAIHKDQRTQGLLVSASQGSPI